MKKTHHRTPARPEDKFTETRRSLLSAVVDEITAQGLTIAAFASRAGFDKSNAARMLSGRASITLDNFLRLTDAAGLEVELKKKLQGDVEK